MKTRRASLSVRFTDKNGDHAEAGKIWENPFCTEKMARQYLCPPTFGCILVPVGRVLRAKLILPFFFSLSMVAYYDLKSLFLGYEAETGLQEVFLGRDCTFVIIHFC